MRPVYAAVVVLTTLFSTVLGSQGQVRLIPSDLTSLEGAWVLDVTSSGLTPADAERRVMSVGPTWLRVDIIHTPPAQPFALIYNLDGSANVNPFGPDTAVTRLTREGDTLRLETVYTVNKQAVTMYELVPFVPRGSDLTIESVLRVEHGYQGVAPSGPGGGSRTPPNVSNAKKIFRKE